MRSNVARALTVALAVAGGAGAMALPKLIVDDVTPVPASEQRYDAIPAMPNIRVIRLGPVPSPAPTRQPAAEPKQRPEATPRRPAPALAAVVSEQPATQTPAPSAPAAPLPATPTPSAPAPTPTPKPAPTPAPTPAPPTPTPTPAPPPAPVPQPAADPTAAAPAEPVRTLAVVVEEPVADAGPAQPRPKRDKHRPGSPSDDSDPCFGGTRPTPVSAGDGIETREQQENEDENEDEDEDENEDENEDGHQHQHQHDNAHGRDAGIQRILGLVEELLRAQS